MKPVAFPRIIVPNFIFTDGSEGVFVGYDRKCCPDGGEDLPKYVWDMGVFDDEGTYFKIRIDSRKSKRETQVTFILDGVAYYHPIIRFWTIGGKVNPQNGHLLPHEGCRECEDFLLMNAQPHSKEMMVH